MSTPATEALRVENIAKSFGAGTNGFTYQGRLKSAGSPYAGSADVQFAL